MTVSVVDKPARNSINKHYLSNRAPLEAQSLIKLPLGAVRPTGWLGHQLDLMVEGMTGRLTELSEFLKSGNGWFGGDEPGWEEQPYWLRGFYPLAVLTGDERCLRLAKDWIETVISSLDSDGYFGAAYHKSVPTKTGQPVCDLWPHMVMLDALIQFKEVSADGRVTDLMKRFFDFCAGLPDTAFLPVAPKGEVFHEHYGDWRTGIQSSRAGDMLPHIFRLYNLSGDESLLDLAARFYRGILPPTDEWLDHHIVHFTQRFSYPAIFGQLSGFEAGLASTEYWYQQHLATWGQQPRGIFAADERIRSGKIDPRQGFETCGMVEFAKSFYQIGRMSGLTRYADRIEDVMLNHFPAAQTPDLKGLHYLTASNQPQLDSGGEHDYMNKGMMIAYSPHAYRCCQHNVAMGWPWYAQHLFQATPDNGLAAWLYSAGEVTARVGTAGEQVTFEENGEYPFDERVELSMTDGAPTDFPLYLRVPGWCDDFGVSVNGKRLELEIEAGKYMRIERSWKVGDRVTLDMPAEVSVKTWPRNGSVTIDRGPLSYSVLIDEEWKRCGGTDDWPEFEVFPASPWNYGLDRGDGDLAASAKVNKSGEVPAQPWTAESAPISIEIPAKRIPDWQLTNDTVDELQTSPIRSTEPTETVTMIPLGCARLRMSCLPVVDDSPHATQWRKSEC